MEKNFFEILDTVETAYFSNELIASNDNNTSANLVKSTDNYVPKSFSEIVNNVYDEYFAEKAKDRDYAKLVDDMAYEAVKGKAKETLENTKNNVKESAKAAGKMLEYGNLGKTLIRMGKAKDNEKRAEERENNTGRMKGGAKDVKKGIEKMIRTKKYFEKSGDEESTKKGTKNSFKKIGKGTKEIMGGLKGYLGNKAHSLNTQGKIVRASYNRVKRGKKELFFSDILKDIMYTSFSAGAKNMDYNQYINSLKERGFQSSLTQEDFSNIMAYPESRIELMHVLD